VRNRNSKIGFIIFITVIAALFLLPAGLFSQTVDSARDLLKAGDYTGAEEELKSLLESEPDNIDALALLDEVQRTVKQEKARVFVEKALIEINNRNFEQAYAYLEQAIMLDPENARARELYLSIHEVGEIEKKSIEEQIALQKNEAARKAEEAKKAPEKKTGVEGAAGVSGPEVTTGKPKPPEQKPEYNRALIKIATAYSFTNSNNLDFIDSKISHFGGRFDGRYYFDFMERRFGVSLDYIGYYIKTSGDESINFSVHRTNVSARYRMFFFETDGLKLTAGARLNYHIFLFQNRESEGAYNFTRIYGPSIGIFFSDPVLYRFIKKDFFKNVGFEGEMNYLFLLGKGSPPWSPELYIGSFYTLNRYQFGLGFRSYSLRTSDIKETYRDIELSAGYMF